LNYSPLSPITKIQTSVQNHDNPTVCRQIPPEIEMRKDEDSDASYSVDDDDPVIMPSGSAPTSAEKSTPRRCSASLSFWQKVHPDNLRDTLRENGKLVEEVQAVLLFRRPVALVVIFFVFNLVVGVISNFNFFGSCLFLYTVYAVWRLYGQTAGIALVGVLFGKSVQRGAPDESNRIRTPDEVADCLDHIFGPACYAIASLNGIATDGSIVGQLTYIAILLFVFVLTLYLDVFNLFVWIVNLTLIVPGILLHPRVWAQVGPAIGAS
jgi:hypothetical protein